MPHAHGHQQAALDPNLATDRGMWALKISLAGLLVTAIFLVVIVAISGSVALLADTIHNFSDALTAIPLGLAFWLSRRARNNRYTYGYGRAEDIAGVVIVLMIAVAPQPRECGHPCFGRAAQSRNFDSLFFPGPAAIRPLRALARGLQ